MRRFLLGLFILGSIQALATGDPSCGDVRLDEPGKAFARIPVYDQQRWMREDSGICYAITAAELIDADRFAKDPASLEKLTSPLSIAINAKLGFPTALVPLSTKSAYFAAAKRERMMGLLGAGSTYLAILWNQKQVVCDQRWLQRFAALFGARNPSFRGGVRRDQQRVGSLENFTDSVITLTKPNDSPERQEAIEFLTRHLRAAKINPTEILAKINAKEDPLWTAREFLSALCDAHSFTLGEMEPDGFVDVAKTADKIEKFAVKADELLDSDRPVAIGYCPQAYLGGDPNCPASHGSIVIGRRRDPGTGSCEYLVRNSAGPSCELPDGRHYAVPCENGSVWIERERLFRATDQMYWLPAK